MKPWTYSRYATWSKCPLFYALENETTAVIDRFDGWSVSALPPRMQGPAALRGEEIHDLIERWLKGEALDLPIHGSWFDYMNKLSNDLAKAQHSGTEVMWEYAEGWYPDEHPVWHRQKLDAWCVGPKVAQVDDHKTGGIYPKDHALQMEVYALGTFARFDKVQKVVTRLNYVDHPVGKDNPLIREFTRDETETLARRWDQRVARLQDPKQSYPAKPGRPQCYYCPYNAKRNQGPCTKGI